MIVFVGVWYLFTIITYGTNVPAGLFLPGMIIGCAMGDLFFRLFVFGNGKGSPLPIFGPKYEYLFSDDIYKDLDAHDSSLNKDDKYLLTKQIYDITFSIRRKYIIIGCAAMMAGYTRMTYAIALILMETSYDLSVFIPMILAIWISNNVGELFTRGLYVRATRTKQMPILQETVPKPC